MKNKNSNSIPEKNNFFNIDYRDVLGIITSYIPSIKKLGLFSLANKDLQKIINDKYPLLLEANEKLKALFQQNHPTTNKNMSEEILAQLHLLVPDQYKGKISVLYIKKVISAQTVQLIADTNYDDEVVKYEININELNKVLDSIKNNTPSTPQVSAK